MSIDLIPDLIKLPHICGAHKEERLIIFVGAGISSLWGCKRWKDMAVGLINSCYEKGKIDFWTRETLLSKYSGAPRKLITIAKSILNDDYLDNLKKTLQITRERKEKLPNLFNNLFSLGAIYITTNIDTHFSNLFDKGCIHHDPSAFKLKPKNICHLHGIISEPDNLVMTVDEYLLRYKNKNFKNFLEATFLNESYCHLFIGYSVDEMEIVDFMIQKYSKGDESKKFLNRFYILLPFFRNEEPFLKYEQLYFDQIKMTVIPYAIDNRGYEQLDNIFAKWRTAFEEQGKGDAFYKFNKIIEDNL